MKWRVLKRVNGLTEFVCEHGVGHPSKALTPPRFYYGTHGCDGCCARPDFPEAKHADSAPTGEAK